ncbi:MAG: SUF system Fe-S cluster assembly regulator [Wenzhouxiangella sp.]|nr:SUF system Fe-S cluster assembly regulator [Wenzhouxiangella sp.]MCH8478039.1 SUF system Fe-S cluster assembly regulator [Wenzhouxiangella sp.]TVR93799.1 MAG: SUF system Fe-S cluster assembly regulator [Wenzhouxiangellaceae bacterium]
MLRISKLTDYATVLMAALARHGQACVPASLLAEQTRLEAPTVSKVLKTLARAGLVDSVRGVNGGYRLGAAVEDVSVAAIVRAMEGPIALTECGLEPGLCSHETSCHLRGNWQRIGQAVEQALEQLSLADLIRPNGARIAIRTETLSASS